ncbi:GNAT family N-acetyltransferase [Permianibacter sp. IMCC34836]|nr:GNAT family N-acetyltransferase [Permianibacter fluminis]
MYWLSHAIRTRPATAEVSAVRSDSVHSGLARSEPGTEPDRVLTVLTRDPRRIPADQLHALLQGSYWARGIPLPTVERALQGSQCMAVLAGDQLLAFARAVTDGATFAWICDVIVHPAWRGRGFGKQVVSALLAQPELQGLRRLLLATADAHTLYQQYGFSALKAPERWLELHNPMVYQPVATTSTATTAQSDAPLTSGAH